MTTSHSLTHFVLLFVCTDATNFLKKALGYMLNMIFRKIQRLSRNIRVGKGSYSQVVQKARCYITFICLLEIYATAGKQLPV